MPGKQTPIGCVANSLIPFASRGRRPSSRVLRGGSFNNQASNVRSAYRNNNVPANRNNNNGFRPASTLPCQNPQASLLRSVPGCKVQVVVPCRASIPAKRSSGPAGLVGRKARRPCRAFCWQPEPVPRPLPQPNEAPQTFDGQSVAGMRRNRRRVWRSSHQAE